MENTKERIITAVVAITAEYGLEGAATAKIAKQAKVAIGTLFHHFPTKQLLFEATYRHIIDHYVWHLMGFYDYPDDQVLKQLKGAIKASIDYWVRNNLYHAFIDQMTSSTYFKTSIKSETATKMDKHFGKLFKLALKRKLIKKYDYPVFIDMLFRCIFQAAGLIIIADQENREAYRQQCSRFVWSALRAK